MLTDCSKIVLKNQVHELKRLYAEIENFSQKNNLSQKTAFSLNLVLDELATNIISHAYQDDQNERDFSIEMCREEDRITCTLEDGGKPFNPCEQAEPETCLPLDQRKLGGLGIHLVRKKVDLFTYQRKDGKNIVRVELELK